MIKITVAILLTATLTFSGIAGYILTEQLHPCPTEDSVNCVWYGPWQGGPGGEIVVNW